MKRSAAVVLFCALLFTAARSQQSRVRELAPGVFVWQGDREKNQPANCGWVVFNDFVIVIDANYPWGAREILPEIRKTTNKPIRFLFNTHYHGDHAFGSSLFTDAGATLVCSEACAGESRTKGQASWDKNTATGEFSLKPYRLAHPTMVFPDSMKFGDGGHEVQLIKVGPGHSRGDSIAWLPKERILFTGDLCVNWRSGNNMADADADPAGWIRALDRLAGLNPDKVVVGHGAISTTAALRAQSAYIEDIWKQVQAGKKAGKTADELADAMDLSRHGDYAFDKERNKVAIQALYRKAP